MKTKTLLTAAIVLALYQAWLNWLQPYGTNSITFCSGNLIRAQRFVFGFHDHKVLYCGSSLTWPMHEYLIQSDEKEVECMALVALGALDGVHMVEQTGATPKLMLLEINHLERQPDKLFQKDLFSPILYHARLRCTALRHGYQPANVLLTWKERDYKPDVRPEPQEARPRDPSWPPAPPVAANRRPEEVVETCDTIIKSLPALKQRLDKLRARGIAIGFYEAPEHPDVTNSEAMQNLRNAVRATFPESEYGPLLRDGKEKYSVSADGEHLDQNDACVFAYFLLEQARLRLAGIPGVDPRIRGLGPGQAKPAQN